MKLEFKAVVCTYNTSDIDRIHLQKIPEIGQKLQLPDDFCLLDHDIPLDRTLNNLSSKAFFERKILKITIEYDERSEE